MNVTLPNFLKRKKMHQEEMIIMLTSLSYMQSAGLTHLDGVKILLEDRASKLNTYGLEVIRDSLNEGLKLHEIFKNNESVFGTGLWRQVDAAERTGKVPECLLRIATQIKESKSILGKIKGAMAYPVVVLGFSAVAGYVMLTTTVPEMAAMMAEFGAELPAITKMVMKLSDIVMQNLMGLLTFIVLLALGIRWALRHPLQYQWHKVIATGPVSGKISVNINYSLVYTLINDMVANGATAVEALRVAAGSSKNLYIFRELEDSADAMEREGISLAEALSAAKSMPSDDRLMMNVAQKTGRQAEILIDLAVRRKAEAAVSLNALLDVMSPVIMLVVCLFVGLLVLAIYTPMLTMSQVIH